MKEEPFVQTATGESVLTYDYIESLRAKDKKEPNPYNVIAQKGCQEKFLSSNADITMFGGNRGGGKCLIINELVCTPFGFREIGKLKKGDIITGLDGGMQKVIYVSHNGEKDVYRLKFIDGSYVDCSYDHLWNIKKTNYTHKKKHMYGLSLDAEWRVWSTEMIIEHLDKQIGKKYPSNLLIPICEPVKFTQGLGKGRRPYYDPYLYGALIGDGCFSESIMKSNYIQFTSIPNEVVEQFINAGIDMSKYYDDDSKKSNDYRIYDERLLEDVRYFKLDGHLANSKFIPRYFKLGTVDERFAFIQGLMDTDGTIDDRGHCSYTTVSKQLAEDVKYMINSLGGLATISEKNAGYKDKEGNFVQCQKSYEIYIRIKESHRLFRLPYKKERSKKYNGGISVDGRRIVGYEYLGKKEVCCISVTNTDSLFIVSEGFVVTHNSFALLMEVLKDVTNRNMNAIILRNEKEDLSGLVEKSYSIFGQFGIYNKSQNDMTWNFYNGGKLKFSYYADSLSDFKIRFQGKEYCYIGFDEITHCPYPKFKYLMTDNRNAFGIRNRCYGTCNPDPDSWVRQFIDWWIDEHGYPIPERDGVIRYCFMDGDSPNSIYWGDTAEEVYNQCKSIIDPLWKPEFEELGFNKVTMFVKSVTFIKGKLEENIKLISSDPNYVANLAQQDEEQRLRDLEGNWNFKNAGDDMIKIADMEKFFNNSQQIGDGVRRASCDIAFTGGDSLVMWLWIGNHIKDIFVCRMDSKSTIEAVKAKLEEWGVLEKNFTYDLNGLGQSFKGFFPKAIPFNNLESVEKKFKNIYGNIKSQCAYVFTEKMREGEFSIEQSLLDKKFSGDGFEKMPLRQILMKERKCIRQNEETADKGFSLITKKMMKKFVGHSPDYFESLIMKMIFDVKHVNKGVQGLWKL